MESCEMSFIKYVLFIFNLIFAISGLGIIVAGAVVLSDVGDFNHFVDSGLLAPPIVLIVAGAIVFIVAFLGCFGAIRESYKLLIGFAVCLLIIFIIELAVGIAAAVYKNDFGDELKKQLRNSMTDYSQSDVEKIAWDNAQKKLSCCGVESSEDWQGQTVPPSCCHSDKDMGDLESKYCVSQSPGKYLHRTGCYEKLQVKIHNNTRVLIGVGIGIAFVEVIGIVLACWLAHSIKKGDSGK